MPCCYVFGCQQGGRGPKPRKPNVRYFRPPPEENLLKIWNRRIPRGDRQLAPSSRICSLHFRECDIIKEDVRYVNGTRFAEPRKNWSLRDGAVPCIFADCANCPSYLSTKSKGRRSPLKRIPPSNKEDPIKLSSNKEEIEKAQEPAEVESFMLDEADIQAASLFSDDDIESVKLPTIQEETLRWHIGKEKQERIYFLVLTSGGSLTIQKTAYVNFKTRQIRFSIAQYRLKKLPASLRSSFNTISDLEEILNCFGSLKTCMAVKNILFNAIDQSHVLSGKQYEGIWRANKCKVISDADDEDLCKFCKILEKNLLQSLRREGKKKPDYHAKNIPYKFLTPSQKDKRLHYKQRKVVQQKQALTEKENELKELKKEVLTLKSTIAAIDEDAEKTIIDSVDDEKAKLALRTIIAQSKCVDVNKRDMRYEAEWLLESMLLRIKSPAAYEHLRTNDILPLPCKETLRRLIGGMSCEFGFNEFALECIEKHCKGKPRALQLGSLIWDEMSITQDIQFNEQTFQFDGWVNEQDNTIEKNDDDFDFYSEAENFQEPVLADHALVLIFRPYRASWIQPFAVFGSKNSASGETLYRLLLKALILLQEKGAIVKSTVCDGAQPNSALWKLCGVSLLDEKTNRLSHVMEHPTGYHDIYFLRDVPHLFKCIRNQIFTHKHVQASGKSVGYWHLKNLFDVDSHRAGGLGICPRLRLHHLEPTSFQKMNVKTCVQVLSNSVADGLLLYRMSEDPAIAAKFYGSEHLEQLIRLLNASFDVMNGRNPIKGITEENWNERKKTLMDLHKEVDATEIAANIPTPQIERPKRKASRGRGRKNLTKASTAGSGTAIEAATINAQSILTTSALSTSSSSTSAVSTSQEISPSSSSKNVNIDTSLVRMSCRPEDMKVMDLKVELKKRSLPVSGTKPKLIERLKPFVDADGMLMQPKGSISLPLLNDISTTSSTAPSCLSVSVPSTMFSNTSIDIDPNSLSNTLDQTSVEVERGGVSPPPSSSIYLSSTPTTTTRAAPSFVDYQRENNNSSIDPQGTRSSLQEQHEPSQSVGAHCQSRSAKRVAFSGGPPLELYQAEDQIDLESWADWSPLEKPRSTLHTTVPFLSKTTMDGLRVTILSTIALVDQLFSLGYLYVLTGKFNQDCIERFFGIIRISGGCQDRPTVSSFLQLFRLLTLYYPTKHFLRGANCDGEERMVLLSSYKDWMKTKFKENEKKNQDLRQKMKDVLLKGIETEMPEEAEIESALFCQEVATIDDNIVYYLCGYLVHTFRQKSKKNNSTVCKECLNSVDVSQEILPVGFDAQRLTLVKKRGKLAFASTNLFRLISRVEFEFMKLVNENKIFVRDAFYAILLEIVESTLPSIGCEIHQRTFMTDVMYQYLCLRFHRLAKKTMQSKVEQHQTEMHKKKKLKRLNKKAK